MNPLVIDVQATDGGARAGSVTTPHGTFPTPCFMPVGTKGAVRHLDAGDLASLGAEVVLANTYHLMLRPGAEVVARLGGLHGFTTWAGPMLTDSGGFQVWSLGKTAKVAEEGVAFASPVNGDKLLMTPEQSMRIQRVLDSDIAMQFDECTPWQIEGRETTHDEARRSMEAFLRLLEFTNVTVVAAPGECVKPTTT